MHVSKIINSIVSLHVQEAILLINFFFKILIVRCVYFVAGPYQLICLPVKIIKPYI